MFEESSIGVRVIITTFIFLLLAVFIIAFLFLFKQRQNAYAMLNKQKQELATQKVQLEKALIDLKAAEKQLIQSAKMASLGELTTGIAHEIQNPLNFVNNFSDVNKELVLELREEIDRGNYSDARAIAGDIGTNEERINHHGKRADAIVKSMLEHSKAAPGEKAIANINAIVEESLKLSYRNFKAKEKSFEAQLNTDFDLAITNFPFVQQDIVRVMVNLFNNAFYALNEKSKEQIQGYAPRVSVSTIMADHKVEIKVSDNGNGIPERDIDKIFQPFFTTKPTGQGTGLGLSLSYDIVKAHEGEITVNTREGEYTEFKIQLPA
ncbi:MAG TPA: ATP-binding protein [Puia sp.]|nr:ATP-binding protein [Puia sp.]